MFNFQINYAICTIKYYPPDLSCKLTLVMANVSAMSLLRRTDNKIYLYNTSKIFPGIQKPVGFFCFVKREPRANMWLYPAFVQIFKNRRLILGKTLPLLVMDMRRIYADALTPLDVSRQKFN